MDEQYAAGEQMTLFDLTPRNRGLDTVDWNIGGIRILQLKRYKTFSEFSIQFGRLTLLVGGNNAGKTSILQALRLAYWCIEKCGHQDGESVEFKKHVIPFAEFHLIPAHELRELVYQGVTPNSKARGIDLRFELASGRKFRFRIYNAYNILMAVEPNDPTPKSIPLDEYKVISRSPLYIPGFFGVVSDELLQLEARLELVFDMRRHIPA